MSMLKFFFFFFAFHMPFRKKMGGKKIKQAELELFKEVNDFFT